jgi:hypothetical protein
MLLPDDAQLRGEFGCVLEHDDKLPCCPRVALQEASDLPFTRGSIGRLLRAVQPAAQALQPLDDAFPKALEHGLLLLASVLRTTQDEDLVSSRPFAVLDLETILDGFPHGRIAQSVLPLAKLCSRRTSR